MQLSAKLAERLEKLKGGKSWEELVENWVSSKEIEREKAQRELEAEKPAAVKTSSEHIPNKIRSYVWARADGKCEFPGCGKEAEHLHHIDRFALKKVHDPDRIVALCQAHHDLAHRGLIKNEENLVNNWAIRKDAQYTDLNWYVDQQYQFYRR